MIDPLDRLDDLSRAVGTLAEASDRFMEVLIQERDYWAARRQAREAKGETE